MRSQYVGHYINYCFWSILFSILIIFVFLIPRPYSYFSNCTKVLFSAKLINLLQDPGPHVVSSCFVPQILFFNLTWSLYYDPELKWSSRLSWRMSSFFVWKLLSAIHLAPPSPVEVICKIPWVQNELVFTRTHQTCRLHCNTSENT